MTDNHLLDNFCPISWGFTTEKNISEGVQLVYYRLPLSDDMCIHISCSIFPDKPNVKAEQAVELEVDSMYTLLPHIQTTHNLAMLIRALSGKSYKHYAK